MAVEMKGPRPAVLAKSVLEAEALGQEQVELFLERALASRPFLAFGLKKDDFAKEGDVRQLARLLLMQSQCPSQVGWFDGIKPQLREFRSLAHEFSESAEKNGFQEKFLASEMSGLIEAVTPHFLAELKETIDKVYRFAMQLFRLNMNKSLLNPVNFQKTPVRLNDALEAYYLRCPNAVSKQQYLQLRERVIGRGDYPSCGLCFQYAITGADESLLGYTNEKTVIKSAMASNAFGALGESVMLYRYPLFDPDFQRKIQSQLERPRPAQEALTFIHGLRKREVSQGEVESLYQILSKVPNFPVDNLRKELSSSEELRTHLIKLQILLVCSSLQLDLPKDLLVLQLKKLLCDFLSEEFEDFRKEALCFSIGSWIRSIANDESLLKKVSLIAKIMKEFEACPKIPMPKREICDRHFFDEKNEANFGIYSLSLGKLTEAEVLTLFTRAKEKGFTKVLVTLLSSYPFSKAAINDFILYAETSLLHETLTEICLYHFNKLELPSRDRIESLIKPRRTLFQIQSLQVEVKFKGEVEGEDRKRLLLLCNRFCHQIGFDGFRRRFIYQMIEEQEALLDGGDVDLWTYFVASVLSDMERALTRPARITGGSRFLGKCRQFDLIFGSDKPLDFLIAILKEFQLDCGRVRELFKRAISQLEDKKNQEAREACRFICFNDFDLLDDGLVKICKILFYEPKGETFADYWTLVSNALEPTALYLRELIKLIEENPYLTSKVEDAFSKGECEPLLERIEVLLNYLPARIRELWQEVVFPESNATKEEVEAFANRMAEFNGRLNYFLCKEIPWLYGRTSHARNVLKKLGKKDKLLDPIPPFSSCSQLRELRDFVASEIDLKRRAGFNMQEICEAWAKVGQVFFFEKREEVGKNLDSLLQAIYQLRERTTLADCFDFGRTPEPSHVDDPAEIERNLSRKGKSSEAKAIQKIKGMLSQLQDSEGGIVFATPSDFDTVIGQIDAQVKKVPSLKRCWESFKKADQQTAPERFQAFIWAVYSAWENLGGYRLEESKREYV